MPKNPNISLSFSSGKFESEIKKMTDGLKTVKKEFDVTNSALQVNGNQIDIAANKIAYFGKQAEAQRAITNKTREALEQVTRAYAAAGQKVEQSRSAYESASKAENTSKEELAKLKSELDKSNNTYERLGKSVYTWNNRLLDSQKKENDLKLAVKQTNTDLEKHNQELANQVKNSKNVVSATGQMFNAFTLIKGLAVGYAGKTLFDALIGDNAKFEQNITSFEVLLGSADKAQKEMNRLTQFAAKTPFTLPQTVEAEKRLLAYGVAAKDTAKVMQVLGDISMGVPEKLDMISLAYGQVVTNQRLYGTELRQFAENGVPLLDELAKMYKVTGAEMRKMIEDGEVSADAVTKALENMTSEGGKFYGMMDKQSKTMEGMWSTLKDNIAMFARDVGKNGFEYLKGELSGLLDNMNQMSQSGQLADIAKDIGQGVGQFISFLVEAVKILWSMRQAILAAGEAFITFKVTMAISNVIMSVVNAIKSFTAAINAGKTATAAFTTVLKANPWVMLASVVASLTVGIIGYNAATKESTQETIASVKAKQDEINNTNDLINNYESLKSKTSQTTEEKSRLHEIEVKLAELYPETADGIDQQNQKYTTQVDLVKKLTEEKKMQLEADAELSARKALSEIPGLEQQIRDYNKSRETLIKERDVIKNNISKDEQLYNQIVTAIAKGQNTYDNADFKALIDKIDKKRFNNTSSFVSYMSGQFQQWETLNGKIKEVDENIAETKTQISAYGESILSAALAKYDSLNAKQFINEMRAWISDMENGILTLQQLQDKIEGLNKEAYISSAVPTAIREKIIAQRNAEASADTSSSTTTSTPPLMSGGGGSHTNEALQNALRVLQHKKAMNEISLQEEASYLQNVLKLYVHNADERMDIEERIYEVTKQIQQKYTQDLENSLSERTEGSNKWIEEQKLKDPNFGSEQEEAAYNRIIAYHQEYLKKVMADEKIAEDDKKRIYKEETAFIKDQQNKIFEIRKAATEKAINDYVDQKKDQYDWEEQQEEKRLSDKKKALEKEYSDIEFAEESKDRQTELQKLYAQEAKYANAATKEGQEKLDSIREQIKSLQKEDTKANREREKSDREAAIDQEIQANKDKYDTLRKDLEESEKKMLAASAEFTNESLNQLTKAGNNLSDTLLGIISSTDKKTSEMIQSGLNNLKGMLTEYQKMLDSVSVSANGQISGITPSLSAVNGKSTDISVTINDYGNKNINGVKGALDYGKELGTAAVNTVRSIGGA